MCSIRVHLFCTKLYNNIGELYDDIKMLFWIILKSVAKGIGTIFTKWWNIKLGKTRRFYYEKVLGKEKGNFYIERPLREKKLPEVISESELLKMLRATDNIKHKTIITILYSSGIRRGELINLRIKDLDFDKKLIFV